MNKIITTVCTGCHTQSLDCQQGEALSYVEHCEACERVFYLARTSFFYWLHRFGLGLAGVEVSHLALIVTNDANAPMATMTEAQASIYCQARGWPTTGIGPAFAAYREWLQRHPERSP